MRSYNLYENRYSVANGCGLTQVIQRVPLGRGATGRRGDATQGRR